MKNAFDTRFTIAKPVNIGTRAAARVRSSAPMSRSGSAACAPWPRRAG
jgi:hypothetical protein